MNHTQRAINSVKRDKVWIFLSGMVEAKNIYDHDWFWVAVFGLIVIADIWFTHTDFFATHHRQALEKVAEKVEGLKRNKDYENDSTIRLMGIEEYNQSIDDALAIMREEI